MKSRCSNQTKGCTLKYFLNGPDGKIICSRCKTKVKTPVEEFIHPDDRYPIVDLTNATPHKPRRGKSRALLPAITNSLRVAKIGEGFLCRDKNSVSSAAHRLGVKVQFVELNHEIYAKRTS